MKRIERMRELEAATADIGMVRLEQFYWRVCVYGRASLAHRPAVDEHVAGQDHRPRPFA